MEEFSTQQYVDFLIEYDALLAEIHDTQNGMLAAITGGQLEEIHHSINMAQANSMRMEQLETRREVLQAAGGYSQLGIWEMAEKLPAEQQPLLAPCLSSINSHIREIEFINVKSRGMVKCTLAEMDPQSLSATAPHVEEGRKENPYEKQRRLDAQKSALETKI